MKKKLDAELISIAHRVLKLKNRSETKQLQEEAKKLYEQLTILRFYEENFEALKEEISQEEIEAKLENPTIQFEAEEKEIQVEEPKQQTLPVVEETEEEPIFKEEDSKENEIQEQPALFDGVLIDDYKDVNFVKVEEVPKEVEKATEVIFEEVEVTASVIEPEESTENTPEDVVEEIKPQEVQPETVMELKKEIIEEEPRTMSLNDKLTRGISFGLNDRIAFEKKLFGGSAQDFNRVLSQLNTFDSFDEAKGFIDDFVKPDYNNWDGKEEYETRFLEIVERKFN
jgi:hypothetical protein